MVICIGLSLILYLLVECFFLGGGYDYNDGCGEHKPSMFRNELEKDEFIKKIKDSRPR